MLSPRDQQNKPENGAHIPLFSIPNECSSPVLGTLTSVPPKEECHKVFIQRQTYLYEQVFIPFIGNLHNLVNARVPHHLLHDLARKHGLVMLLRMGQMNLVVVTSRKAAHEQRCVILAKGLSSQMVPTGACCVESVSTISSPQSGFNLSLQFSMKRSILCWLSTFSEKSPVLVEKASEVANNVIARATFEGRCKRQDMFSKKLKEVIEQTSLISPSDLFPWLSWMDEMMSTKYLQSFRIPDAIVDETVQEHLKSRKQRLDDGGKEIEYNLVDVLAKEMENDNVGEPITLDTVKAVILDMLAGGTDTAAIIIECVMAELITHPVIMAKVQEEVRRVAFENVEFDLDHDHVPKLDYLKLVIKETLRLHPPGPLLLPRQCKETCELLGYSVPPGARVLVNALALGRDPEYWRDSEEFIPERFGDSTVDLKKHTFEYILFGAGRRKCRGGDFGMAVVEIALSKLLFYFDWKLPENTKPSDVDMTEELAQFVI